MTALLASVTAQLVSFYKPLLMLITFVPWAWLVSSKLEKDARYFHLNRRLFNAIYLGSGFAALAAMVLVPIFWVGWPLGILLLGGPVYAYWKIRDKSVPEDKRFTFGSLGVGERLSARKQARAARGAVIRFMNSEGDERKVPVKEDPLYPIHLLSEDLIGPALERRAAQVDVSLSPRGATVTQTIDGIRYKREPIPAETGLKVVDYLKEIAGLAVEDRRRRQTGVFRIFGPTGEVEAHLTTAGSSTGQELRIEFDRSNRLLRPFDGLGLLPSQIEALRVYEDLHERHGIILMGAPPSHGLSTTSYSFLARHDAYTSNIKTLEREVLVGIDGVDHVRFDPSNPNIDFATNLQSILRRDPDMVLVGAIPDHETARVVTEPGMAGPLIYIPIPAPSVAEVMRKWVKLVGDLKRAVSALRVVTNQRLLRTLCQNCRQAYQPSAERLSRLSIPAGRVKHLYQAGGKVEVKGKFEPCPVCGGTGYLGQTAAFEVMVIDDKGRELLLTGDLKAAQAHARRNKMIYLQEAALAKVVAGETTIEELVRVTAPGRGAAPTPKPQADPAPAT